MRRLRHLINSSLGSKSVVEITARTAEGQFLLEPDAEVNAILAGVLARAKANTGAEVYAHAFLSNHFHLMIGVDSAKQMADFMMYLMGNIARKINLYRGRSGPFWQRRYRHIEVSKDPVTLAKRFVYILKQGVKEGLVSSPLDWPGLHCAKELYEGKTEVSGKWEDRSKKYRLEQGGKRTTWADVTSEEAFDLDPLPSFATAELSVWFSWVRDLVDQIVEEYRGQPVLGSSERRRHQFRDRPKRSKQTYAVDFHVSGPAQRKEWRVHYRDFVRAFRAACGYLEGAKDEFLFPPGSFPPNAPFVPESA